MIVLSFSTREVEHGSYEQMGKLAVVKDVISIQESSQSAGSPAFKSGFETQRISIVHDHF